jgi:hypothetical protein
MPRALDKVGEWSARAGEKGREIGAELVLRPVFC